MLRTALVLVALALAPAASAQNAHSHAGHEAAAGEASAASERYGEAMERMHAGLPAPTGDAAVDFAQMMIPHHESAVEMAQAYLASGDEDPVLRQMSQDIVRSQEAEIATLREWLAARGR